MKLQERLPEGVEVDGKFYRMDFDFRNVLEMMETMARDDLMVDAREYKALKCVMKRPPKEVGKVMEAVRKTLFPNAKKHAEKTKITDFKQDAALIRAAFLQSYRINLFRDKLHWIEFSELLSALPEGSRYQEVIGIRVRPYPKATKYNAEERQWLAKAKAACALEMDEDERVANLDKCIVNIFHGLLAWAEGRENGG